MVLDLLHLAWNFSNHSAWPCASWLPHLWHLGLPHHCSSLPVSEFVHLWDLPFFGGWWSIGLPWQSCVGGFLGGLQWFPWCLGCLKVAFWCWLLQEKQLPDFHWIPLTFTFQRMLHVLTFHQQSADVVEVGVLDGSQSVKMLAKGCNQTLGVLLEDERGSIHRNLVAYRCARTCSSAAKCRHVWWFCCW